MKPPTLFVTVVAVLAAWSSCSGGQSPRQKRPALPKNTSIARTSTNRPSLPSEDPLKPATAAPQAGLTEARCKTLLEPLARCLDLTDEAMANFTSACATESMRRSPFITRFVTCATQNRDDCTTLQNCLLKVSKATGNH